MELLEGQVEVDDVEVFLNRLRAIADRHGTTIQAIDGRYVAGREHLERALRCADRAFDHGEAIADDRGLEVLLYAAGRRQIDSALEMGVDAGEGQVVVVVDGGEEAAAVDAVASEWGELERVTVPESGDTAVLRQFHDIGDEELDATTQRLEILVCERVALLSVEK